MPTLIHFVGGADIVLGEDFDKVNNQLASSTGGLFTRFELDNHVVSVFRINVLYLEEASGEAPFVP